MRNGAVGCIVERELSRRLVFPTGLEGADGSGTRTFPWRGNCATTTLSFALLATLTGDDLLVEVPASWACDARAMALVAKRSCSSRESSELDCNLAALRSHGHRKILIPQTLSISSR